MSFCADLALILAWCSLCKAAFFSLYASFASLKMLTRCLPCSHVSGCCVQNSMGTHGANNFPGFVDYGDSLHKRHLVVRSFV
jgi:hypothetical protein